MVGAPEAREPPATEIFAVVAVSATRWKSGAAAGKSALTLTGSSTPLTERIADWGAGPGAVGVEFDPEGGTALPPVASTGGFFAFDDPDEPDDLEDPEDAVAPCCWNGSLLEKRVKLVS